MTNKIISSTASCLQPFYCAPHPVLHYIGGLRLIALSLGHIIKRHTPLFRRKKPTA